MLELWLVFEGTKAGEEVETRVLHLDAQSFEVFREVPPRLLGQSLKKRATLIDIAEELEQKSEHRAAGQMRDYRSIEVPA